MSWCLRGIFLKQFILWCFAHQPDNLSLHCFVFCIWIQHECGYCMTILLVCLFVLCFYPQFFKFTFISGASIPNHKDSVISAYLSQSFSSRLLLYFLVSWKWTYAFGENLFRFQNHDLSWSGAEIAAFSHSWSHTVDQQKLNLWNLAPPQFSCAGCFLKKKSFKVFLFTLKNL